MWTLHEQGLFPVESVTRCLCMQLKVDMPCTPLQGLLCGVLQVIIQKLSDQDSSKAAVTQYADSIMEALLSVMACHSTTIHEEAMLAIGALTYACGPQFSKYMERFYPYLQRGLTNYKVGPAALPWLRRC